MLFPPHLIAPRIPPISTRLFVHWLLLTVGLFSLSFLAQRERTRWIRMALVPPLYGVLWGLSGGLDYDTQSFHFFNYIWGIAGCYIALLVPRLALLSSAYTHSNSSLVSSTTIDLLMNPSLSLWNKTPYFTPRPPKGEGYTAKGHALAHLRDSLAMGVICVVGYPSWGLFERKEFGEGVAGKVMEGTVTLVFGFCVYLFVELVWHANAALFVGLLGWDRTTMTEIFDRPWKSTSVHDFWARRWHPLLSPTFAFYSFILPSALQAPLIFFLSGLIHDLGLLPLTPVLAPSLITLFFSAQLAGIVLEVGWKKVTGRKVEGWWGFVWVWVWFGWTGRWVFRGWADKGVVRLAMQSVFWWLRDD